MRAPVLTSFVALAGAAVLANACMETRRALGEDCLKDDDCLSGLCSQLRCAGRAQTFDTPVISEASAESAADVADEESTGDAAADVTPQLPDEATIGGETVDD